MPGQFTIHRRLLPFVLALSSLAIWGCDATPHGEDVELTPEARRALAMKPDPNVIEVGHYYSPYRHWIWTEDQSRVRGTWISSLYLYGNQQKGVFGDGVIRPRIYLLQRKERGGVEPKLLQEWAFDVEAATFFRSKKPSIQGYGYKLPLEWGDLDLSGKEIRVIVTFERADGRTIESSKKDLIVPGHTGEQ